MSSYSRSFVSLLFCLAFATSASAAPVWQVRQEHPSFGPIVEYLDQDRFRIELSKNGIVIVGDAKTGKALLWNKVTKKVYRGPLSKIEMPISSFTKIVSDLDTKSSAWKKGKAEISNGQLCATYTSIAPYRTHVGKGWFETTKGGGSALGRIWCEQDFGLSRPAARELCRILVYPDLGGVPLRITAQYGTQRPFDILKCDDIKTVKPEAELFQEPKNYMPTGDLGRTTMGDDSLLLDVLGR